MTLDRVRVVWRACNDLELRHLRGNGRSWRGPYSGQQSVTLTWHRCDFLVAPYHPLLIHGVATVCTRYCSEELAVVPRDNTVSTP